MDVELKETGLGQKKLVLTSSGLWAYVKSAVGGGAYYSVRNVAVSEGRNFIEHTMPGRKGSVFQDMGRPAIKITIEGNIAEDGIFLGLWGKNTTIMLEELHKFCDAGKPVDFLCDMPTLFGVSRVVIQGLEATEVKGRKHNYNYKLTLKEWTEGPSQSVRGMKNRYLASVKSDAKKEALKKGLIVAAGSTAAVTYMVATSVKADEALTVTVKVSKSVVTPEESADITASVFDSKGNAIADADVTITKGDKQLFSGKSNADGAAVATFQSPDDGNYEIKASAKKSGFSEGKSSASITVDTLLKTKLTTDMATIKAAGTPNTANIKVTVTDCNGKAIEGVAITLTCTPSGPEVTPASASTDANGVSTATVKSTTAGTYEIAAKASKSPYKDGNASISIKVT
jgi:hypothetical protein